MHCVTFIACALAVIGSGCGSDDKPKPPPPPTDGTELLESGAAPRTALRYKLAPSISDSALQLAIDVDLTTPDLDLELPTILLGVDLTITTVDPDGTAHLKMTVATAGAEARNASDNPAMKIMDRQTKLLAGTAVTYGLTPSGAVKDTKVAESNRDLSGPMQDQVTTLLQASEQLAMALPAKPVGVGAVWKHRRTMKLNQLTLVTVTLVEVVAIDGDKVTFKSTTEMTGADQTLAQGSATAQVTAVRGTGSQTGTFELGRAILLGESKATLGFEMITDGARRPTTMTLTTRITPREPVEPPKP